MSFEGIPKIHPKWEMYIYIWPPLNQPIFAGFSICAENPSESSQRDLVARPRTSPWGARFSGLLKSRPRIDTPGRQPGNPGGSPIAKGCSLKWSSDSLQWHSPSIKQRRSLSISRRFSLKRGTWFPFRHWAFLLSPFAQTVVKFAFKKDQHNALKVCYIRTWKNSSDGELAQATQISMEEDQWSNVCNISNGFYTDL